MSVQNKTLFSVLLFVSLFSLVVHYGVDAFHVDKPMIYINFFDEVVTDNTSSKFIEKVLSTTSTPSNISDNDIRKKPDLSEDHLKLNDVNKTSSVPYDSIFEFDMPSKADITEISVNESDVDPSTTTGFSDLMDPELLEPDITRMFFLKAIASLIEHIMEALFSIDDTSKFSEPPGFDYDLSPSRNFKKRDVPDAEHFTKLSDAYQSVEHKTGLGSVDSSSEMVTSASSHLMTDKKNTEQTVSSTHKSGLLKKYDKLEENMTEHHSQPLPAAIMSDHIASHHGSHRATVVVKSHAIKRENEPYSLLDVKSKKENSTEMKSEVLPGGNLTHLEKLIVEKNLPVKPANIDTDDMKIFHFSDESSLLNDEVENKDSKLVHDDGIPPTEEHNGLVKKIADQVSEEEINNSSFTVVIILVGTTVLILMLLGAFALAAGYFFRKNQESENQNTTNVRAAVA